MSIRLASFSKKRTEAEVVELSDTYFRKTLRSYLSLSVLPSPSLPICICFFPDLPVHVHSCLRHFPRNHHWHGHHGLCRL